MKNKITARLLLLLCTLCVLLSSCARSVPAQTTDPDSDTSAAPPESTETLPAVPDGAAVLSDYASFVSADGDWAPALEAALGDADTVYIPAGTYLMSRVVLSSGKTVCGAGDGTVIIQKAGSEQLFNIQGSRPRLSNLAADMDDFSDTLTTRAELGVSPGDTVYVLSQRNCMILEDCGAAYCLGRSYASGTAVFYSEFLTVASVKGKTITTTTPTRFPYYYADGTRESDPLRPTVEKSDWPYRRGQTTVYVVSFVENVTLRDFSIREAVGFTIYAVFARNLTVENLTVFSPEAEPPAPDAAFVRLLDCLDCEVRNSSFRVPCRPDAEKIARTGDFGSYALLKIVSCTACGFDGCSADFGSHVYNITKKHTNGVSADCYIRNCTATGAVWSGAFVTQGTVGSEITGCDFEAPVGIMCAGRGSLLADNTLRAGAPVIGDYMFVKPSEGGTLGIALTEGYAIDAVVKDNRISGFDTAVIIRDGYEKTNIFEQGKIEILGNTADGAQTALRILKNSSNTRATFFDLTVRGNSFTAASQSPAVVVGGEILGLTLTDNHFSGFSVLLDHALGGGKQNTVSPNDFQ